MPSKVSDKVVVTGGAGFIGSHLVDRLISKGFEVWVVDNLSVGLRENLNPAAHFVEADLRFHDPSLDAAFSGAKAVFHQAAKVSVRASLDNFREDAENNILGTLKVLELMGRHRVKRLIQASSMAVYGEKMGEPSPLSVYGLGKLTAERYAEILAKAHGFELVNLRYFNVYGSRQAVSPYVGVITTFMDNIFHNRPHFIYGDGEQRRDYVHVSDIVEANVLALSYTGSSLTVDIGSGRQHSVLELAQFLREISGIETPLNFLKPIEGELRNSVAQLGPAELALGYRPQRELKEGLLNLWEALGERRKPRGPRNTLEALAGH